MVQVFCNFIAGWACGVSGLTIGYPLDTIKVNQQIRGGISTRETIRIILKKRGYKGFFRGLTVPWLANGTSTSLCYGVHGLAFDALLDLKHKYINVERTQATLADAMKENKVIHKEIKKNNENVELCCVAGTLGAFVQLILSCPVEVVKVKLQTTMSSVRGPIPLFFHIVNNYGWKGLYRGLLPQTIRDVTLVSCHCYMYGQLLDYSEKYFGSMENHNIQLFLAGGIGGTLSWSVVMPFDVIKTRLQADDFAAPRYKRMTDCIKFIWRDQGWRGFFRGTIPMSLRAFPVSGAIFFTYEWLNSLCMKYSGGGGDSGSDGSAKGFRGTSGDDG